MVEAFGMKMSLRAWARIVGMPRATLHERLSRGWPPEQALKAPRKPGAPRKCAHPHDVLQKNGRTYCSLCKAAYKRRWNAARLDRSIERVAASDLRG